MLNYLWGCTAIISHYWSAARHGLKHNETEGFINLQR